MRRLCRIFYLSIIVSTSYIPQLGPLSIMTYDIIRNIRTLLKSAAISRFLYGRQRRVSLRDYAVPVLSMAWCRSGSVSREVVFQVVLDYLSACAHQYQQISKAISLPKEAYYNLLLLNYFWRTRKAMVCRRISRLPS